jgi:phage FluMu protein Com
MKKTVRCTKCCKAFEVVGEHGNAKEFPEGVTCPYCSEPNEVSWPMGIPFFVRKVPSQM